MEEQDLLQSNGDDEVAVKQSDGSFKVVKLSALQFGAPAPVAQSAPIAAPPTPMKPKPVPQKPVEMSRKPAMPPAPVVFTPPASLPTPPSSTTPSPPKARTPEARPQAQASIAPQASGALGNTNNFEKQAEALAGRLAGDTAPDMQSRLKSLLISYLKGIRQEYAVRVRLLQPVDEGGLGWDEARADLFLKQFKALRGEPSDEKKNEPPAPIETASLDSDSAHAPAEAEAPRNDVPVPAPSLLPEIEPEMQVAKADESPKQLPKPPQARPTPARMPAQTPTAPRSTPPERIAPSKKIPPAPFTPPKPKIQPIAPLSDDIRRTAPPVIKIVPPSDPLAKAIVMPDTERRPEEKMPPHIAIPQAAGGKAQVHDIAFTPRLVGPIEELRRITLADFRRLSRDPVVSIDKIHSKIELLGEESFEKKLQGIEAWHASEVYRMYAGILSESVMKGNSVGDAIAARSSSGRDTLTVQEFNALMQLNTLLRY